MFCRQYICLFENLLVRVDHDQRDLKTSPLARISNHRSGRDQVGSQMNIITDKTHASV